MLCYEVLLSDLFNQYVPSLDFQSSTTTTTTTTTETTTTPTSSSTTDNYTETTQAAASTSDEVAPGPSSVVANAERIRRELESLGMLEGVDPSFLAALPDNIR